MRRDGVARILLAILVVVTAAGLLLIGRQQKIRELMPTAEAAFQMLRGTEVSVNESFFLPLLAAAQSTGGITGTVIAMKGESVVDLDIEEALEMKKDIDEHLIETSKILSLY